MIKLPNLPNVSGGKKIQIPVINRSISRTLAIVLVLAAGGGIYLYSKGKLFGGGKTSSAPKKVAIAPKVSGAVSPNSVKPNSFVTVTGSFSDEALQPVATREARYYMFEQNTLEGIKLVSSGLLGTDVSRFQRNVPTTGLNVGQFLMLVTDEPLSQTDIGPLNAGPQPFGTGQGIIPVGGSTAIPGVGPGITLS